MGFPVKKLEDCNLKAARVKGLNKKGSENVTFVAKGIYWAVYGVVITKKNP